MDYAIQLFLPIIGGLMLGYWLNRHLGFSPLWMLILAVLGMIGGIGVIYKRSMYSSSQQAHPQQPKDNLKNDDKK